MSKLPKTSSAVLDTATHAKILSLCKNWTNAKELEKQTGLPLADITRILGLLWRTNKHGRAQLEKKWNPANESWDYRENKTPRGLVTPQEVPAFWGLLEQRGIGLTITKFPELTRQDSGVVARLAHIILWAQDGVRDALWQEIVNRERAEDEEYRKQKNINNTP